MTFNDNLLKGFLMIDFIAASYVNMSKYSSPLVRVICKLVCIENHVKIILNIL